MTEYAVSGLVRRPYIPTINEAGVTFALTPEMIIAMTRSRLNQMDEQIANAMATIENRRGRAQHLGEQLQKLRDIENALRDSPDMLDGDKFKLEKLNDDSAAALRSTLDFPEELASEHIEDSDTNLNSCKDALLAKLQDAGMNIDSLDNELPVSSIDNAIHNLEEQQRVANSENEMLMMQLQSAVQQRTQIVQLGSNMLASVDKASDAIIQNMR